MNALNTRVIDLAKQGVPPRDIAGIENVDQSRIYTILRQARAKGVEVPYFRAMPTTGGSSEPPKQIVLGLRLHRMLEFAAEKRGVCPNELARDLLEAALLRKVAQHG